MKHAKAHEREEEETGPKGRLANNEAVGAAFIRRRIHRGGATNSRVKPISQRQRSKTKAAHVAIAVEEGGRKRTKV